MQADYHMKQLWFDLSDRPTAGVDVECHYDKVCVVQLASWRRGLVLGALVGAQVRARVTVRSPIPSPSLTHSYPLQ